jgi:succinate dehydrogenase/fumarate reductase flavoprotein subunit
MTESERDKVYDVIVVGAGAGGMAAACTAAAQGQRVLLLEGSSRVGGTTAISGGMVWIPASHKMAQAGLEDSPALAHAYLEATVPGAAGSENLKVFLDRCDEAITFLEAHTTLKLRPVRRYPDYYPEHLGSTAGGRVLEPEPFDGSQLRDDFALLRDPLPEFLLFGGMMVSREDLPILRQVTRSPSALWHAAKVALRYASQRLRAHRGTTLYLGNSLAARLLASLRQLGVELKTDAPVRGLLAQQGRVAGVFVDLRGSSVLVRARRGVILATGGISHHGALRQRYVPSAAGDLSATVNPSPSKSGVAIAEASGAQLSTPANDLDGALAFWVPASVGTRKDGSTAVFPHTVTDRAKPGLIAVNRDGVRFVNEAVSYHEFVRAQLRRPERNSLAWLVCDKDFLWKYGLGRVRPFALSLRRELGSGYLKVGSTLAELAAAINVPADTLMKTVATFNEAAKDGRDPEFGRGSNIYQRHLGDAQCQPNPCVAPLLRAPFYAVAVQPADLGMAAGVVTDANARALRADGTPIEGLYVCGNDMHSVMNGAYPAPGITLGPALVFGYLAALHASEQTASREPAA